MTLGACSDAALTVSDALDVEDAAGATSETATSDLGDTTPGPGADADLTSDAADSVALPDSGDVDATQDLGSEDTGSEDTGSVGRLQRRGERREHRWRTVRRRIRLR